MQAQGNDNGNGNGNGNTNGQLRSTTSMSRSKSMRRNKKPEITQNPPASDFPILQKLLKVWVLSLTTVESLKNANFKLSVVKDGKDVVPPIELKPDIGECELHFQTMFSFMLPSDIALEQAELQVELQEKKMLRVHKYGGAQIGFNEFINGPLTEQKKEAALDGDTLSGGKQVLIAKQLTKPESKHNPNNRGTFCCQVELSPMTYKIDLGVFFQRLPHQVSGWVIFVKGPEEDWDSSMNGKAKGAAKKSIPQASSPSERFRTVAAQLLSQLKGEFCFGEAELSQMSQIRMGTRIVAMSKNNKKLSFLVTELFEHRLTSFVQQFNTESSGVWAQAAEQIRQMNPSTMMDLAGDAEMADFAKIATLGTLFREVADWLDSGIRELRAEALNKLATSTPHALCSVALQVPFDTLIRELDGVIYDAQTKSLFSTATTRNAEGRPSADGRTPRSQDRPNPRLGVTISPAYGPTAVSTPKGRVSRALAKAGKMLKWSHDDEFDEWGVDPFDDSSHYSGGGSLHGGSVHGLGSASPFTQADRTWHGSEITDAMRQAGGVEYSAVPRHGTVPYPVHKSEVPQSIQLREGMLDALQLLAAVLGQRFIETYAMPCLKGDTVDNVHLASLIGKLYYSSASSESSVSSELRELHLSLLQSGNEQQRVNAVSALADIARLETMEASAHVEECCRLLEDAILLDASAHPALLEAVVMVIPSLFRLPDEDILHLDVGVRGGAALTHQIQHSKSPQGLQHVSRGLLKSLCSMLATAIVAFHDTAEAGDRGTASPRRRHSAEPVTGVMMVEPAPKPRKSRQDLYVNAALALLRTAGKEQWAAIQAPWDALLKCLSFREALGAGLPLLCRQLSTKGVLGSPQGRLAIPEAQGYIQAALNHCLSTPPNFEGNPTKAEVCLWTWKQMQLPAAEPQQEDQAASPVVKLLSQLPCILSAVDHAWPERKKWVRVMQAVYSGYFADRLQVLENEPWTVEGDKVLIDGQVVKEEYKICDPLALAYQLPAAIRLSKEESLSWSEAISLHMYMGFDESNDIRWMISHSIHLMPALLGEECLDVLCETFNKLFQDDDVDVAEGIVKNYMHFVKAVADVDSEKAAPLALHFFDADPSHWERRLTFQSYHAAQMVLVIECGLCPNCEDRAMQAILELKEHHCPQVRKRVVREMVEMLTLAKMAHKKSELLQALVAMSQTSKCRQRQSFLWACEYAYERCPGLFTEFLLPALRFMVETKRPGSEGRSLTMGAPALLARVEGRAGPLSSSESNCSSQHMDVGPVAGLQMSRLHTAETTGSPLTLASAESHVSALTAAYERTGADSPDAVASPTRTWGGEPPVSRVASAGLMRKDTARPGASAPAHSHLHREDTPWQLTPDAAAAMPPPLPQGR